MGLTIDEKIEEDLKHCSLNGVKYSDYVKEHYISKSDYENRLKADLVAMLEEISLEIEEKTKDPALDDYDCGFNTGIYVSRDTIQQKIDKLKEAKDE